MAPPQADRLERYRAKRDFTLTPEPAGVRARRGKALSFVIQKHDATRLHYDFRLEFDGVLLSWAVPKGPSFDPSDKRMAVRTEDHPMSYADFEGTIPPGHYGAGNVIVWDRGTWTPLNDPADGLAAGKLAFELHGEKLAGVWELVRMKPRNGERQETWLLFKKRDGHARPHAEFDVVAERPDSVITARPLVPRVRKAAPPKKVPLPATLAPQLATLAAAVPTEGEWTYEIKYDGYRVMTRIERGVPAFLTRGGHDWTAKLPSLARAVRNLGIKSGWLDGELVMLNDDGVPDFNALQNAFDHTRTDRIVYVLFDVPFLDGRDLRSEPLRERRRVLKALLDGHGPDSDRVRFSPDIDADPASILASACRMKLEGVIAKRADAPYESRRSTSWLKLKCQQRQEFVIAGFTARRGVDGEVGSLLLGVHDERGRLVSVGSVGTGWDTATSRDLWHTLARIEAPTPPFAADAAPKNGRSRRGLVQAHWVKPTRLAEVSFGEWTPDQQIRHAVFVALRADKPARQITREKAVTPTTTHTTVKISNPDRVIDPGTGATKLDLVRYYDSMAEFILPHLKGRPCSLVRGPDGIGGELFFQKHTGKLKLDGVKQLDPALWPEHEPLMEVGTEKALASATQMNTIEFHTWNAKVRSIGKPDRIVFDIDPGEGVGFPHVREAATLTRALLAELGLEAWLKTSGGKGLHVVVPIAPRLGWDTVKDFSRAVVAHMAHHIPDRFVVKSGPSNRVGKIFIDYLRNGHGATTVVAFSARARPGLGVSMPLHWDELDAVKAGNQWTIANAREHLSFQKSDPWAGYAAARQPLGAAIKRLAPKAGSDK